MMIRQRRTTLVLGATVLAIGSLMPLSAATATTPTLAGETLDSRDAAVITGGNCDPGGVSTFTFTVSGQAFGPYPGTFTESGTVTLGPQDTEIFPHQFASAVTDFKATFTIYDSSNVP